MQSRKRPQHPTYVIVDNGRRAAPNKFILMMSSATDAIVLDLSTYRHKPKSFIFSVIIIPELQLTCNSGFVADRLISLGSRRFAACMRDPKKVETAAHAWVDI